MKLFPLLAAALGMSSLTEDDDAKAAGIVEDLAAAKEERDSLSTSLAEEKTAHAKTKTERDKAIGASADQRIAKAYTEGKLLRTRDPKTGESGPSKREARLRRIAGEDGLEALDAELEDMPKLAPTGVIVLDDTIPEPAKGSGGALEASLASAAKQLGHKPEELSSHAATINGARGTLSLPTKEGA